MLRWQNVQYFCDFFDFFLFILIAGCYSFTVLFLLEVMAILMGSLDINYSDRRSSPFTSLDIDETLASGFLQQALIVSRAINFVLIPFQFRHPPLASSYMDYTLHV